MAPYHVRGNCECRLHFIEAKMYKTQPSQPLLLCFLKPLSSEILSTKFRRTQTPKHRHRTASPIPGPQSPTALFYAEQTTNSLTMPLFGFSRARSSRDSDKKKSKDSDKEKKYRDSDRKKWSRDSDKKRFKDSDEKQKSRDSDKKKSSKDSRHKRSDRPSSSSAHYERPPLYKEVITSLPPCSIHIIANFTPEIAQDWMKNGLNATVTLPMCFMRMNRGGRWEWPKYHFVAEVSTVKSSDCPVDKEFHIAYSDPINIPGWESFLNTNIYHFHWPLRGNAYDEYVKKVRAGKCALTVSIEHEGHVIGARTGGEIEVVLPDYSDVSETGSSGECESGSEDEDDDGGDDDAVHSDKDEAFDVGSDPSSDSGSNSGSDSEVEGKNKGRKAEAKDKVKKPEVKDSDSDSYSDSAFELGGKAQGKRVEFKDKGKKPEVKDKSKKEDKSRDKSRRK